MIYCIYWKIFRYTGKLLDKVSGHPEPTELILVTAKFLDSLWVPLEIKLVQKLYLLSDFKKWVKLTVFDFKENSYYVRKGVKGQMLELRC